jgi:hypothetical protein
MRICAIAILCFVLLFTGCTVVEELQYGDFHKTTIYESGGSVSFPNSVRLRSGELLVVFREETDHFSGAGKILKTLSKDGKHWTVPDTLVSTGQDCRDPSIVQLRDGLILVNFYQALHDSNTRGPAGCYTIRSFDNGKTFTIPRRIEIPGYDRTATSDGVLELQDGSLLLPVYAGKQNAPSAALVLLSRDSGETWNERVIVGEDSDKRISYEKPAVCLLPDGSVLCLIQKGDGGSMLVQTLSKDGGKTWSRVRASGIYGYDPDIIRTSVGSLLCVYRDCWPQGVSTMRSYDWGTTWEAETVLYSSMKCSGSPGLTFYDENVFAVFVESVPGKQTLSDDKTAIRSVRFTLRKPDPPKGCSASVRGNSVRLRWNSVSGAVYYRIYRDQTEDFSPRSEYYAEGNLIATPILSQYTDTVQSGQTYYYRISAVAGLGKMLPNSGGESDPTEVIRVDVAADTTAG